MPKGLLGRLGLGRRQQRPALSHQDGRFLNRFGQGKGLGKDSQRVGIDAGCQQLSPSRSRTSIESISRGWQKRRRPPSRRPRPPGKRDRGRSSGSRSTSRWARSTKWRTASRPLPARRAELAVDIGPHPVEIDTGSQSQERRIVGPGRAKILGRQPEIAPLPETVRVVRVERQGLRVGRDRRLHSTLCLATIAQSTTTRRNRLGPGSRSARTRPPHRATGRTGHRDPRGFGVPAR
jgi:hypothetical protein